MFTLENYEKTMQSSALHQPMVVGLEENALENCKPTLRLMNELSRMELNFELPSNTLQIDFERN